jgi:hypothetical protein
MLKMSNRHFLIDSTWSSIKVYIRENRRKNNSQVFHRNDEQHQLQAAKELINSKLKHLKSYIPETYKTPKIKKFFREARMKR